MIITDGGGEAHVVEAAVNFPIQQEDLLFLGGNETIIYVSGNVECTTQIFVLVYGLEFSA